VGHVQNSFVNLKVNQMYYKYHNASGWHTLRAVAKDHYDMEKGFDLEWDKPQPKTSQ
jgi:hypothetical protein